MIQGAAAMGDELASLRPPQVGGEGADALHDAGAVFAPGRKDGGKTADGGAFKAFRVLDQTGLEGRGSSQLGRDEQPAEVSGEVALYLHCDRAQRRYGASTAAQLQREQLEQRASSPLPGGLHFLLTGWTMYIFLSAARLHETYGRIRLRIFWQQPLARESTFRG